MRGVTLVSVTVVEFHGGSPSELEVYQLEDGTLCAQVNNPRGVCHIQVASLTREVAGCLIIEDQVPKDTGVISNNGSERVQVGRLGRLLERNFCLQPYKAKATRDCFGPEYHIHLKLVAPTRRPEEAEIVAAPHTSRGRTPVRHHPVMATR